MAERRAGGRQTTRRPAHRPPPPRRTAPTRRPPQPAPAAVPESLQPLPPVAAALPTTSRVLAVAIPLLLFAAATMVYAHDLRQPHGIVFDEFHYIRAARSYTNGTLIDPSWSDPRPVNFEHPPLAKYLIAGSMTVFGDNEYGWRLPSVLVGAAGIAGVFLLGRRLFSSVPAGLVAATFLLWDPMYFLHARLAMLDIFPAALTPWAFALALGRTPIQRMASGLVFGLAVATKYNAVFLLPPFLLLHWTQAPGASRRWRWLRAATLALALPAATWLASYVPYFLAWARQGGFAGLVQEFLLVQVAALSWDFAGNTRHCYSSPAWSWIPMVKPVWYYVARHPEGTVSYIWSIGNPVLWWPASVAAVVLPWQRLVRSVRARGRTFFSASSWASWTRAPLEFSSQRALLVASILFLLAYLPWFLLQRISFLYYATFFTPYLALLAAGILAGLLRRPGARRIGAAAFIAVVAAAFALWYPLASGAPVVPDHYTFIQYTEPHELFRYLWPQMYACPSP